MSRYGYKSFNKFECLFFRYSFFKTCLFAGVFIPLGFLHGVGIRGLDSNPMMGMPGTNDPLLENDVKKMENVESHAHRHGEVHEHEHGAALPASKKIASKKHAKKDQQIGEHSSFFVGINYQASAINNKIHYNGSGVQNFTMSFPPLMGVGLQIGYKQFFGKKRSFGLRYFAFFDYNHNRLGVLKAGETFDFAPYAFAEKDSYAGQYTSNLYTYGAGMDMLYNFVSTKSFIFGLAVGVQFAGDSWASSIEEQIQNYVKGHKDSKYSPANFQFLVNFALRAQISKSNGIELGVKIPTITHRYFSLINRENQTLQADLRRIYAFQVSYIRDF